MPTTISRESDSLPGSPPSTAASSQRLASSTSYHCSQEPCRDRNSVTSRFSLAMAVAAGCATDLPQFRPNLLDMAQNETPPEQRKQIALALTAMFGTPDEPFTLPESGLDLKRLS